jgi:hypothetical protein
LRWQFSEEGKEWRWPSQAKRATSDTPASWSAKRKGKAYELKSDPDDDDLFVPRTSTTPSSCNGRKQPGKTSCAAARKKAASTSSTPPTAGTGTKGGKTSSANAKKAVATAKMYSMGKKKDGEGKEDDDSDDFMESKSKKRPAQDAEPVRCGDGLARALRWRCGRQGVHVWRASPLSVGNACELMRGRK